MTWNLKILKAIEDWPQNSLFIGEDEATYRELGNELKSVGKRLDQFDISSGECIIFERSNSLTHFSLLLACLQRGAIFVPIDPKRKVDRKEIVQKLNPRIWIDSKWEEMQGGLCSYRGVDQDTQIILLTSGTTGNLNPVSLHSQMIEAQVNNGISVFELSPNDRVLIPLNLSHSGGLTMLTLASLTLGCSIFVPSRINKALAAKKAFIFDPSITILIPALWDKSVRRSWPKSCRVITGSHRLEAEFINRLSEHFLEVIHIYGMTEVGPCAFYEKISLPVKTVSIGKPVKGLEYKLSEKGELLVKGDIVARTVKDREGFFNTNDILEVKDNDLVFIEKSKSLINMGGVVISPGSIESKVLALNEVTNALAYKVESTTHGEILLLDIVLEKDSIISDSSVRKVLTPFEWPKKIYRVKELARNENGKPSRALAAKKVESSICFKLQRGKD